MTTYREKINIDIIFDTAWYIYEIFSTDYIKNQNAYYNVVPYAAVSKKFLKFSHELHIKGKNSFSLIQANCSLVFNI